MRSGSVWPMLKGTSIKMWCWKIMETWYHLVRTFPVLGLVLSPFLFLLIALFIDVYGVSYWKSELSFHIINIFPQISFELPLLHSKIIFWLTWLFSDSLQWNSPWVKRRHLTSVLPGFSPPQSSHFPLSALYSALSHELLPSGWKQINLPLQTPILLKRTGKIQPTDYFPESPSLPFWVLTFLRNFLDLFIYMLPDPWINPFLYPNGHFFPVSMCKQRGQGKR